MLHFDPKLLKSFEVFDVVDPDELGDDSRISRRFPGYNNQNTYRLRDRRAKDERPGGLISRLAVRREGGLLISYIASRFGTDIGIVGNGVSRLFLTFSLSGSIAMQTGSEVSTVSSGTTGLIYPGRPGTRLLTTDGSRRITIQIDEARLLRLLGSLLDDERPEFPRFTPGVDWTAPSVAPITRLVRHLIDELDDPTGLFSVPAALESVTDTLLNLVLTRLPHSQTERLQRPQSPAIPRQLRRAEAFIEAHAGQPISMADIAAAAGCSARALQMAFRQFRDTTPLAALRDARLHAVRAALASSNASAAVIAREFGFSNPSRFHAAFRRRFGDTAKLAAAETIADGFRDPAKNDKR